MTKEDVKAAVKGCFDESVSPSTAVRLSSETNRGNRMAYVKVPATVAPILEKRDHIRLGWVNCRVHQKFTVERCFRCLGFGHIARQCVGPDRTGVCWRCGEKGHVARNCSKKEVSCFLCENVVPKLDTRHVAGTAGCRAPQAPAGTAQQK
ncbi:zinc finger protein GIS2-like [Copidosoma floridanum]|uniref:zinc finger protein GIS2-like n=1 Tax=Copidosoma floridanum TaxID=29053 RepID=UPI0006C93DC7|nr:zinc finger protein GIS2-like [Copidosoma floridanum]